MERPELVRFYSADLRRVSFLFSDVSQIDFSDVIWPPNKIFPGRYQNGKFVRDTPSTLERLEILCQQLKLNYQNRGRYADAGDFHYAEMEERRRRLWSIAKGEFN